MTNKKSSVLSLAEEVLSVDKQSVLSGAVQLRTETEVIEENLRVSLDSQTVELTRIAVNKIIDAAPAIRTEGDVTIIPIIEEVAVVQKQLILKEELHIRRRTATQQAEVPVTRRKQRAVVERQAIPLPRTNEAKQNE